MTIATQRYKNDARLRRRLFVPSAFAHPAKGHISLWEEMILRYSKEGDLVLDPLAGIGTSLIAALMGRNVICVELEQHFVEPMRQSWEKMRNMPMLGYQVGEVAILRGDARCLPLRSADWWDEFPFSEQNPEAAELIAQSQGIDLVVSSPPYEGSIAGDTSEATRKRIAEGKYHGLRPDVFTSPENVAGSRYGDGYTRPVDAIVTSPPYIPDDSRRIRHQDLNDIDVQRGQFQAGGWRGSYSTDEANIGNPRPTGSVKGAIQNIGNLRGRDYWSQISKVYSECWRVLRPGGILALVLKGFTRDGQYVDLPGQTEALLLAAGWQKHDHWRRELWGLSFWRTLQRRRDPAAFDERLKYEEVRAYRKPGADGGGVAAVITSPPYESSLDDQRTAGDRMAQLYRNVDSGNVGRETRRIMAKGFSPNESVIAAYTRSKEAEQERKT